jgi:PBP1b-binding outer membrane lipoprotein LpoB
MKRIILIGALAVLLSGCETLTIVALAGLGGAAAAVANSGGSGEQKTEPVFKSTDYQCMSDCSSRYLYSYCQKKCSY